MIRGLAIMALVLVIDIFIPLGVAVGVLYVIAIVSVIQESRKIILFIAALASVFTLGILLIELKPDTSWMVYANRSISLTAIWITTAFALRFQIMSYRRKTDAIIEAQSHDLARFVHAASHDMKTPLRAIANLAHFIEEDLDTEEQNQVRTHLQKLKGRVHRMENLIDGILKYSSIGQHATRIEPVDLAQMIDGIVLDLQRRRPFQLEIRSSLPTIQGDPELLHRLLWELIHNAVEHNPRQDARVILSYGERDGGQMLSVEDNGPGIERIYWEKVFVLFQKLKGGEGVDGAGVGLAIAKKIVDSLEGRITVESEAGKGAKFIVWLPKR